MCFVELTFNVCCALPLIEPPLEVPEVELPEFAEPPVELELDDEAVF